MSPPRIKEQEKAAVGNREHWLTELSKAVLPIFKGFRIDPYRVCCSWPCKHALGLRRRRVGECHAIETSKAGVHEIFISPLLDDPLEVAGVVCHELAHVVAGVPAGHAGKFVKVCKAVGLTKNKPTQAAPGELLNLHLRKLLEAAGPYPHQAVTPLLKEAKPSSTLRLECESCSCKVSISTKWVEQAGLPTCGCGGLFALKEKEE